MAGPWTGKTETLIDALDYIATAVQRIPDPEVRQAVYEASVVGAATKGYDFDSAVRGAREAVDRLSVERFGIEPVHPPLDDEVRRLDELIDLERRELS